MDDLISRRAAIDDAHRQIWYRMNDGMKDRIDEWLKALPSVNGDDWILCNVREPEENQICWITAKTTTERVWRGRFTKRYGERRDCGFICNDCFMWWNTALAWKPCVEPAPYQLKEDT